ncbi:hypothetical protein [Marivirga arenosa]|uniref:Lipocalin-like domain-containing protein n=1 Tax=Marivirga arenosa TaxID=3059076 RepID=A0AA49GFF8_9BACT|nr:hypothetical protein [Marivirga sp. BKB1-2]WKK82509.1 hypothetical protein QYS47_10930 [Marivirga sp. BKB1-2]
MKTKISGLLIIISIVITSCNTTNQQAKTDLLTSTNWLEETKTVKDGESKWQEYHSFHKDGQYSLKANEMTVTGEWNWTDDNEIYLQFKNIEIEGSENNLEDQQNYYIKILEVSENKLKTLERFEGDDWDSGFAKERNFKAI